MNDFWGDSPKFLLLRYLDWISFFLSGYSFKWVLDDIWTSFISAIYYERMYEKLQLWLLDIFSMQNHHLICYFSWVKNCIFIVVGFKIKWFLKMDTFQEFFLFECTISAQIYKNQDIYSFKYVHNAKWNGKSWKFWKFTVPSHSRLIV